jgi:hypothetical protein
VPATLADVTRMVGSVEGPDGTRVDPLPDEEALRGRSSAALLARGDGDQLRRFSIRAVPLLDGAGGVRGAVAVWRDVTELHAAITAVAQLDGAVKTARRVTHEMGNALAPALGYGDMLSSVPPDQVAGLAGQITHSIERAAAVLERLGRLDRYAEVELGGGRMLDLDSADRREAPTSPAPPRLEPTER